MFLVCGKALFYVFAPARPEPDGRFSMQGVPGGSPFNVAIGLARLGAPTAFLAGLSEDALGSCLLERLTGEGIAVHNVVRRPERTPLSLVGLAPDGAPAYSFCGGGADTALGPGDLPPLGPEIQSLHVGSYAIAVAPMADALAEFVARERAKLVTLDPTVRLGVAPDRALWRARIAALLSHVGAVKASDKDLAMLWPGATGRRSRQTRSRVDQNS